MMLHEGRCLPGTRFKSAAPGASATAMTSTALHALRDAFKMKESVVTAFSGGVDSAVLARVGHDVLGDRALAVIVDSESYPRVERDAAVAFAEETGVRYEIVKHSELADPRYAANPVDRCYFCRQGLADVTLGIAREKGYATVAVGTNASDLNDYRPGGRAIQEAGLWQPFLELGVDKDGVRALARELGLPVAEKPSMACLSSRIPYGDPVTAEKLARIERAESWLRARGFRQVRVRTLNDGTVARVEVLPEEIPRLESMRDALVEALRACGYARVEITPEGYRTGALNVRVGLRG
jgi:pyridinium-3,5-biscarboxylic acid mononucleotide sulfurtransferase